MSEFLRERDLPDCCRRSYRGPNGSWHRTRDDEAEFTCMSCGADWTVEFGLHPDCFDEAVAWEAGK